jgi:hypothetical protein
VGLCLHYGRLGVGKTTLVIDTLNGGCRQLYGARPNLRRRIDPWPDWFVGS